jgi:DNA-binding CsgD family transcriptional regulator
MPILSNADLTRVLQAVTVLNSGVDLASLGDRSLSCVALLIPNEMTAFDGFDREGFYNGSLWYSPPGTVPLERVEILGELVHEHPNFHRVIQTPSEGTFRTSDAMPLAEFHRTTLYNEFYRIFGGETQIAAAFRLAPDSLVTCSIHRPTLDFDDREHEALKLITPHLRAAFRNAQFVSQLDSERRYLNRAVAKGVVALEESGGVVFTSQLAEKWLRKYFGENWGGPLPTVLVEYVSAYRAVSGSAEYFRPGEPLIVSNGSEELKITATFDTREREVLIFLEERRQHTVTDFELSGVTHREAEILYWIGRGKTDPEIACLLSISTRTVQKHVEHIFTKFGVETRTAAVMRALDSVG